MASEWAARVLVLAVRGPEQEALPRVRVVAAPALAERGPEQVEPALARAVERGRAARNSQAVFDS